MREIREILRHIATPDMGEANVLATVVELKGSGYRLPGARMLIKANDEAVGTVSGGCLEADILERAKRVRTSGLAEVFVYDTTANLDSVFSLNMGCRGVIRILLERVARESSIVRALERVSLKRERLEIATLLGADANAEFATGSRVIFCESTGETIEGENLLAAINGLREDLLTFAGSSARFQTIRCLVGETEAEFVFETLHPPVRLLILGAGADAVPLAAIGFELGWQIDVVDHRPAFLTRERFPFADALILAERDSTDGIEADDLTAIVSMNHNFERDGLAICAALKTNAFYVGALGPKTRTQQILDEAAVEFTTEQLSQLRSPAGLDIGGDSPETIAVSIIAEIQGVLKNREGGPLRERETSIYDRS